jgi:hypothetical protein
MPATLLVAQHRTHPTIVHAPHDVVDLTDARATPVPTAPSRPALPGPAILRQSRVQLGYDAASGEYHLSITAPLPRW